MPRQLRLQYPGALYHVLYNGDRREPIFAGDRDRRRFLETLGEACQSPEGGHGLASAAGDAEDLEMDRRPLSDGRLDLPLQRMDSTATKGAKVSIVLSDPCYGPGRTNRTWAAATGPLLLEL
jgi:hypothetical protein